MSAKPTIPTGSHVHGVPRELPEAVDIYDTTLRDGSQQEGLSLTVDDKLRVAEQLDHLGVQYIEGGWPGANPKDEAFFQRAAAGELQLERATLVAFGSTRKAGGRAETDPVLAGLIGARTGVVCLVALVSLNIKLSVIYFSIIGVAYIWFHFLPAGGSNRA